MLTDIHATRSRLESAISDCAKPSASGDSSRPLWRSLEELADDDAFAAALRREFPEYANRLNDEPSRRQFLELMGASLALAGVVGCAQQPQEEIVTYVRAPEQIIPGKPLYYATALTHDGAAMGVLVESHMGRPTKIEGNPLHPAVPEVMRAANDAAGSDRVRFGATDAYSQAAVLSLYDPDRSQTVLRDGQIDTWESFAAQWQAQLTQFEPHGGRGLRVLTETVVSPTLAEQLRQLFDKFPNAQWHQYEPINRDNVLLGARLAFGQDVEPLYHIDQADVILSLDADFLVEGPMQLQYARGFADRRRVDATASAGAAMNRLYIVEASPTLTGAAADHRLPLEPDAVSEFAVQIAAKLGLESSDTASDGANGLPSAWIDAVAADLQRARGKSLVLAGRGQPPAVHALAHWMNNALGNVGATVEYREPSAARPEECVASLRDLVDAMQAEEVQAIVIVGGNPVYDSPADLLFAAALRKVPLSVQLSQFRDETSAACTWHIPEAHVLESWSDTRAADGTASIVQPLIEPLYRGKTTHELLNTISGNPPSTSYDLVRGHWQQNRPEGVSEDQFDAFWKTALHDGIVAGTESPQRQVSVNADVAAAVRQLNSIVGPMQREELRIVFRPDSSVWDGRYANSGWLQELPRPLTKITWDNVALVSTAMADEMQLKTGDVVECKVAETNTQLPVFVLPGHARNSVTVMLGYGRSRAGRIGTGVGTNVYPLRTTATMWSATLASLSKTGASQVLATTQHHFLMEGRHLVRAGTLEEFQADPKHPTFMAVGHEPAADASLYPPFPYEGNKWGMAVNLSACIGCSSCVVACQAENNVPIVGKEQVARGREMHWLRIDHYYDGEPDNPASYHQPVMCQHCELAPCEPVCPVAATTHSDEGLNEMTYNRCVGTRYCANNCPYKVRRFNFLEYNGELRQSATLQLLENPDVTVRSRGVMEKCTYCVQRINAARIDAEKQDRAIADGEVVTACQAACPTQAIVFGNLNDTSSEVTQAAKSSLNYSLLGDLNTRPRTTYNAVVRNLNPALASAADHAAAHNNDS